jgi:hypothetical protein
MPTKKKKMWLESIMVYQGLNASKQKCLDFLIKHKETKVHAESSKTKFVIFFYEMSTKTKFVPLCFFFKFCP